MAIECLDVPVYIEMGLHYNYFRDYEPGVGRYLQSDPIGLRGGTTTYSYVLSNPFIATDEYGLMTLFRVGLTAACEAYGISASLVNWRKKINRERCQLAYDIGLARESRNCNLQRKHVYDMARYQTTMRGSFDQNQTNQCLRDVDDRCDEILNDLHEILSRCRRKVGDNWFEGGGCELLTLRSK